MKQVFTLIIVIVFLGFYSTANGQATKPSVIPFYSLQYAAVFATAIDASSDIISVGDFMDSAYIQEPSQNFSGKDSFDAFVICCDDKGVVIWKKIFGAANSTWATNVVCDHSGNCYVTGYFESGFTLDGIQFDSANYYNAFLMKLDHNGKVIWGTSYAVSYNYINGSSVPQNLVCDEEDNLYYDMVLFNPLKINGQVFSNLLGKTGTILIKFDQAGKMLWEKTLQNRYGVSPALTTDLFGHLYIGGSVNAGEITWGGANLPGPTDSISEGLFIAKIDANNGNMLWIQRCTGNKDYSQISFLNMGHNGELFAAGFLGDTLNIQGKNYYAIAHPSNGYQDAMVLDMDTSGKIKWLQHYGEFYEPMYPNGFCMDRYDHIYIGGSYVVPVTFGSKSLFSTIARDIYIMEFNKNGNYIGSITSKAITKSSYTLMIGLMNDSQDNIFATGYLYGQTNFAGDTIANPNAQQSTSFIWELPPSFTAGVDPVAQIMPGSFRIYPNPLNGSILNLEMARGISSSNMEISCINATGRIILREVVNSSGFSGNTCQLQLPGLKKGLYFIKLVSGSGISVQKFVMD